jgi:catechol 2,3-dioxygenase-like lactoylglutathione lyase family enzyme
MSTLPSRRRFLGLLASIGAAVLADHGRIHALGRKAGYAGAVAAGKSSATGASERAPRILGLELLSAAPLAEMKEFYGARLGMRVVHEGRDRLTLAGGRTPITFVRPGAGVDPGAAPAEDGRRPFYHFAFNIPENKLLDARGWQKERSPLMSIPERLRDPRYPDDVVHFRHWNAHSIFFFDPAGNIVEYIARHDMNNAAPGPFGSRDILYASEIGLIVDDVQGTAVKLKESVGVERYRGGDDQFTAMGDEEGLLLVMKRGRHLNFDPSSSKKAAGVFRTAVRVRGTGRPASLRFSGFPYEIAVGA